MKVHLLGASLILALCLVPARALGGETPAPPAPAAKASIAVPALQYCAVVGASVSAGFGLDPSANAFAGEKSKLQMAQIVDASIAGPHERPFNGADLNFFSSPEGIAKRAAADAKAAKPTALVAIDYLFWMGYGPGGDEKREERVNTGLKHLEAFACPVLVGDLPDFRGAGTNPMFLPKESIPSAEALARMNKRIYAWAKERKNVVVVVPMAEMLRKLIVDEPFTVGGTAYEKGSKARLLQSDNLHTTVEGTCALWVLAAEAWSQADASVPSDAFLLDIPALAKKAEELSQSATPVKGKGKKAKSGTKKDKVGAGSGG